MVSLYQIAITDRLVYTVASYFVVLRNLVKKCKYWLFAKELQH